MVVVELNLYSEVVIVVLSDDYHSLDNDYYRPSLQPILSKHVAKEEVPRGSV